MNTFCTDLESIGFPPKKKKIQKVCTDIILIDSVVINHSAKTLNGKDSNV